MDINNLMDVQFGTMAVHISTSQVHGLLDAVRNLVLEWALKLERAGINGEGMSFNREEKQLAKEASTTINIGSIGSMIGNLGSNNSSGDISASRISTDQVGEIVCQLKSHVPALKAAGADAKMLDKALSELSESNPTESVTRGALTDLRNALSGAAGSLIASGAITMITKMLGG
jgi:AbiTii